VKRKVYRTRGEKQGDFFVGFFIMAVILVLTPTLLVSLVEGPAQGLTGPILAVAFLVLAGIYRPWMALGGLGCVGSFIALGLLAAMFIAVVCSSGFR
jgi:hypothetical protein